MEINIKRCKNGWLISVNGDIDISQMTFCSTPWDIYNYFEHIAKEKVNE